MSHHDVIDDFVSTLDANRVQEDTLKFDLSKAVTSHDGGTTNRLPGLSEAGFPRIFKDELSRLTRFVQDQQEGLELSAKALFLRADALVAEAGTMPVQEGHAALTDLKIAARKTVDDCFSLQDFFTSNRTILVESASVLEKHFGSVVDCSSLVWDILPRAHLDSSLVCVISDIYNALRQAEEIIFNQNNGGDELWQAPSSFQRATTKYWVKDQNLTKLMMTCAIEAPLLVYGKKGPLTSTKPRESKVPEGDKLWDSLATRITSIYFDSADLSLYKERLARAEGAQLLRARWYGTTMPSGHQIIFLELKTHHEKWVANNSVKERASIQAKDMVDFLRPVSWERADAEQMILRGKPKIEAEELEKATGLLLRMHNLVLKHGLTACVRSVYDRAAFQSSKSNDLRLTLDRKVTLVNERVESSRMDTGQWCLSDSEAHAAPATVVPFNVFEVKLAGNDPMPTGLAEVQSDSTIELATKFSKFLTGAAAFNTVPTLPYWAAHPAFYSFFELDRRGFQGPSSGPCDNHQGDYNLMSSADENGSGILPKRVVIAPQNPPRIEPKTYFANERTFVQWISASILLLSISSFMLAAGHYNTTAAVISLSALVLIVYSTHLYFKRLNLLKVREPYGYFNKVNPIFLTSVVGLAILLVWADSVNGKDILDFFSRENNRRMLRPLLSGRVPGRVSRVDHGKCFREAVRTKLVVGENRLSSLTVDSKRRSFLMTTGESIYIQPMNVNGSTHLKADRLIRIYQSHLQGLAIVGNQLFALSGGPEHTQMIEMAWWETRDGNERLRVVGRWTLEDSRTQVDGLSFVPSTNSTGGLYVNMNSTVRAYSLPARRENEEPDQPYHPVRLRSLNMKVLTQATNVLANESDDRLSTMATFEGITYFLKSKRSVLAAWNLTDSTMFSEIELPATEEEWTSFALERRTATGAETPNIRSARTPARGALFLHLVADGTALGGQVWSFRVAENDETPSGLFPVRHCRIESSTN